MEMIHECRETLHLFSNDRSYNLLQKLAILIRVQNTGYNTICEIHL